MAVEINDKDGNLLTIDPTSKAARVTVVDSLGVEQTEANKLTYYMPIYFRLTNTFNAGDTMWAMRNGFSKKMEITRFHLIAGFDATAGSLHRGFQLRRFRGVAPTGWTTLTSNVINSDNTKGNSTVNDIRVTTGSTALTTTGVEFDSGYFPVFALPISATGKTSLFKSNIKILLDEGEGLAIQTGSLTTTSMTGVTLSGMIVWDEY